MFLTTVSLNEPGESVFGLIIEKTDVSFIYKPSKKMQIMLKNKTRTDEKAQHTWEYVSILKKLATPKLGIRCIFEMACINPVYRKGYYL